MPGRRRGCAQTAHRALLPVVQVSVGLFARNPAAGPGEAAEAAAAAAGGDMAEEQAQDCYSFLLKELLPERLSLFSFSPPTHLPRFCRLSWGN